MGITEREMLWVSCGLREPACLKGSTNNLISVILTPDSPKPIAPVMSGVLLDSPF